MRDTFKEFHKMKRVLRLAKSIYSINYNKTNVNDKVNEKQIRNDVLTIFS